MLPFRVSFDAAPKAESPSVFRRAWKVRVSFALAWRARLVSGEAIEKPGEELSVFGFHCRGFGSLAFSALAPFWMLADFRVSRDMLCE